MKGVKQSVIINYISLPSIAFEIFINQTTLGYVSGT
jgi:hypothetical protein